MGYPEDRYRDFWHYQGNWSQDTFGKDSERGPKGPLLHLQKEVTEAMQQLTYAHAANYEGPETDKFQMEIVDCFFLVTDVARRSGLRYHEFMDLCFKKLEINQNRTWQKPTSDQPVEHDRSKD